jgi:antagonist of KipI
MLRVLKSGFYTTIQDIGRFGFRAYGVPVSGAMDSYSSQFANAILGNTKDAALLEITMTGPTLHFLEPTIIAISGANLQPKLNNRSIKMNLSIIIETNDILSFGRFNNGLRVYVAIKNGFLSETVLGSRSMYKPVTRASRIINNDTLDYNRIANNPKKLNAHVKYSNDSIEDDILEVHRGPEFNTLPIRRQHQLLETSFRVSKYNNRMAYQLEPTFENPLNPILTAPVLPGTIQLTPAGRLIVLMRDCQTTGGYPRVLQLTEKAITILSQKTTGNSLKLRLKDV